MQLIDTHCHLDSSELLPTLSYIVAQCQKAGISNIIIPGIKQDNWFTILQICNTDKTLHPALGLHPMFLDDHHSHHLQILKQHALEGHIIAIGEIGLDFQIELDKERQKHLFEAQLKIAHEANLPVILHVRKAHDQTLSILRKIKNTCGGIVHSFNGSLQQADKYMELGFLFGIGGAFTYDRAKKLQKLAATLPLKSIVLETDAPYMLPASRKNQPNSPEFLVDILEAISKLRPESKSTIAKQTTNNAKRILHIYQ
jgi:TatD DNase family protein